MFFFIFNVIQLLDYACYHTISLFPYTNLCRKAKREARDLGDMSNSCMKTTIYHRIRQNLNFDSVQIVNCVLKKIGILIMLVQSYRDF